MAVYSRTQERACGSVGLVQEVWLEASIQIVRRCTDRVGLERQSNQVHRTGCRIPRNAGLHRERWESGTLCCRGHVQLVEVLPSAVSGGIAPAPPDFEDGGR